MEFGNYMMFSNSDYLEKQLDPPSNLGIWNLEFDGSCTTVEFGAGVVLASPSGNVTQLT